MLSKESFKKNFVGCCAAKGITVDEMAQRFVFDAIKDRFDDAEFEEITKQVFLEENFYGKMPDISLWTKRKANVQKRNDDEAFLKARQDFQDKVMELCYCDYVPADWKDDFNLSLTPSEAETIASIGEIGVLWSLCRKNGQFDDEKADFLVRRLQNEFKNHYRPDADNRLRIVVERNDAISEKVAGLISATLKKI